MAETTTTAATATAAKPANNNNMGTLWARAMMVLGFLFLAWWLLGILMEVQSSEAFIAHAGDVNIFQPNFALFGQLPRLVGMGDAMSATDAMAAFIGWGVEFLYLAFIAGYELLHHSIASRSGQMMAGLFRKMGWGIVAYNGWTNFNYGSVGTGFIGHLFFSLIMFFIVGFFGTVGVSLIERGWKTA